MTPKMPLEGNSAPHQLPTGERFWTADPRKRAFVIRVNLTVEELPFPPHLVFALPRGVPGDGHFAADFAAFIPR